MSSIIKKHRGGRTYLYAATSARVEGRPRIVEQVYLGAEDEVIARLTTGSGEDPSVPDTEHRRFGDVAAVWGMLARLDAITVIDSVVGAAPVRGGVSVGTYLGLAALNRVCEPRSKRAFADWWARTAMGRITRIPVGALDHRRFWDAMDAVTVGQLEQIEAALTRRMIEVFGLDTHALILDMTNFATFIDSGNQRAPIAQRGKAKQKRYDLRIVGLGLVATRDGGVPLLSRAYPGNQVDVTQFQPMIEELAQRYTATLGGPGAATLTFDAGQNSLPNFTRLAELGLHFVGSVPPSDHPGLLARPAADRHIVPAYAEENLTAFETTAPVLGQQRRVILTHSPSLHTAQQAGFAQTLRKATTALTELAARLARGRTRRPRPKVQAEIDTICAPRWVARVITTELTGDTPATLRLTWRIDPTAQARLEEEIFGKRILVTDHDQWPQAQVIDAYRSQEHLEAGFRQAKDPHVVSFAPIRHFTDHKIRVHLFTCVLALAIAHLMRREAARAGLPLSVPALLAELDGIGETVLLYQGERGRPRARHTITRMTSTQQRLYKLFDLGRYTPHR
ncbi:MAG TPA: IS1634 family transposase [Actinomycetota bacterium]|nr:IS1634 family transposase [Actinomycetota bacterium]